MNKRFSWESLFSTFKSREIDTEELEGLVRDAVLREHPMDTIKNLKYTEDGIEIIMESEEEIEIEIDWNEIILT